MEELTKWHGWNAAYTSIVCGIDFILKYLNKPDCKEKKEKGACSAVCELNLFPKLEAGRRFTFFIDKN